MHESRAQLAALRAEEEAAAVPEQARSEDGRMQEEWGWLEEAAEQVEEAAEQVKAPGWLPLELEAQPLQQRWESLGTPAADSAAAVGSGPADSQASAS